MFLIKKDNLYFYTFQDSTTYEGYLDKKHPLKTLLFVANQYDGMRFNDYKTARDFMLKHGIDGNIVKIDVDVPKNKTNEENKNTVTYDEKLLGIRNDIEGMIDCSEKNFKHMCNGILIVTINTLNRFLRNPYEVSWFTRRKIIMNYENYFKGAGMK